jgi:hypothetical protein
MKQAADSSVPGRRAARNELRTNQSDRNEKIGSRYSIPSPEEAIIKADKPSLSQRLDAFTDLSNA